jgi:hypothetical protein
VDGHACYFLAVEADFAGVQAESHGKPDLGGGVPDVGCASEGSRGAVEDGEEPVACGVDFPAAKARQ